MPSAVFGSLAHKWNSFNEPEYSVQQVIRMAERIPIHHFRLQKRLLDWDGDQYPGFMEWCAYSIERFNLDERHLLAKLADFALFCGLGEGTTRGLGQTRRLI